ncbi:MULTISPECIES: ABC transporter substrate-binding protein [unclassified Sphingomonas]|uniref:ABC transporter substrate-binding protein n=1 Tax=unclassified Sphingomonas TaxID=196159 RepID=UPI000928ABEB|nr:MULTISPECIES: ABC transporter substrate-binding protein [unclassified Sphingomonas]MBN8850154.1 ABC transporter substrate-binding protein [Sphingomonas sp.]OJV28951.1 MAG: nitrate ABC transporter permease [Sphingomonas sp. 67-36]
MRRATLLRMMPGLAVILAIAVVTLFSALRPEPVARAAGGKALTPVRFNMSWLPQGSMAGVFVALDRGYYADAGLRVEAMRGFGGTRTVNELDRGMFEFGYVDPLSVAMNRASGGHARLVGGINMRFPAGACFVRERHHIASPADLAGLTFGAGLNSPVQTLLPAWLRRNGVDPARVRQIQLDPAVVVAALIEGKVDAAECWLGNSMALFEKRAKAAGVTIGRIDYADFGFDVYGSGIATRDALIARDPDLVRRFLAATYRGYADAARDPDAALAIMRRHFPLLDADVTRQQIVETAGLMAGTHRFDPARIANTIDFLKAAGRLGGDLPADALFTNQYLDERAVP